MSQSAGNTSFVLSDAMREYFTAIGIKGQKGGRSTSGQFPSLIQVYYMCMVLGVAKNRRGTPQSMSKDMVRSWAGSTKANEDLISGVAFYKFSESKGYDLNAPDMNVLKGMNEFFHRHEEFTPEAYFTMNQFAQGGFELIEEEIPDETELADWMSVYIDMLME